jgi:hypothetical protein
MLRLSVVLFTTLCLSLGPVKAQQQVRLCFSVTGAPFCTVVTSTNKLPTGAGTVGNDVGRAVQIRLCYAVPNSPFCQVVDAAHPLPVQ